MNDPSTFIFALRQPPMTERRNPPISSRRQPKQNRSSVLVSTILEAAIQVLAKEGVHRFTTTRVAERAGVSVGSVYQYFPNKASILFRLQSDEWRETTEMLCGILQDSSRPPLERLRILVHAFIRSECDEVEVRTALNDAAPFYRDAPEAQEAKAAGEGAIEAFLLEALPEAPDAVRALARQVVTATLKSVGKDFSETPRSPAEIETFSDALADMLCGYLRDLAAGASSTRSEVATATQGRI